MSLIKGLFNAVLASTDGGERLLFWCPGCKRAHGPSIGPGTGPRWSFNGDYVKPVFTPSLLVTWTMHEPPVTPENHDEWHRAPWPQTPRDYVCHSFIGQVRALPGQIQFLDDCTHALAGQVVDIPQWIGWGDDDDDGPPPPVLTVVPRVWTADQLRRKRRLLAVKIAERRPR